MISPESITTKQVVRSMILLNIFVLGGFALIFVRDVFLRDSFDVDTTGQCTPYIAGPIESGVLEWRLVGECETYVLVTDTRSSISSAQRVEGIFDEQSVTYTADIDSVSYAAEELYVYIYAGGQVYGQDSVSPIIYTR